MHLRVRLPEGAFDPDAECSWVVHDSAGEHLREGRDRVSLLPSAAEIELIAPASRVLLTQVTLPRTSRQRMRHVLRFAIDDRITADAERVHAALGPPLSQSTYAVAIVDREWLTQWIAAFGAAGRAPRSVLVETCLPPLQDDTWTLVWRGAGGFVRTGLASGMAVDGSGSASPPAVLQLALAEAREKGDAPAALLVRPADSMLPDLDRWTNELEIACVGGEPWDWKQRQGAPTIDLLQGELAPRSRAHELMPRLKPALILASLILVLHVFGTVVHWAVLTHERAKLQSEMRDIFRAAFPQAQAIVDPALQMRRQLEALKRASGELQSADFMPLLAHAAQALAGEPYRVRSVYYDRGRLAIDVELGSASDAQSLLERVKGRGASAVLEAVNPRGAGADARLSFTGGSGG